MPIGLLGKRNREINKVVLLPLSQIHSNPNQPRKHFDREAIEDLSRSILANGLLQPVTVRRLQGGGYELIAGERRAMAFRSMGKDLIPAIIEDYTEQQSAVMALIENLQRKDLNYFEEAAGIAKLMDQLQLTQHQVSEKLGKAQSTVANKLRLLRFSPEMQTVMLEAGLTERHARALLKLTDGEQLELALHHIIEFSYNVEQTELFIERLLSKKEQQRHNRTFIIKDMRIFQNSIQKAVSMMNMAGIPVQNKMKEDEEHIVYTIKIPKSVVYKTKDGKRVPVSAKPDR